MEATVEYPDAELTASPTLGMVFRVPTHDDANNGSDDSDHEDRGRPRISRIRPHSAKVPSLDLPSRVLPSRPKGIRPWSAQPKITKSHQPAQRKVSRQTLMKPHLRPPARSPSASVSSETSSLITAVGQATIKAVDSDTQDHVKSTDRHAKCSATESTTATDRLAVKVAESIREANEQEANVHVGPPPKPEPAKRTLKKHPSFETWVEGSPHDSDEYDTDLDIEDFVKNAIL